MTNGETPVNEVRWTLLISAAALSVGGELLPVVFGQAAKATWDWSFLYVMSRFLVVPLSALIWLGRAGRSAFVTKRLPTRMVVASLVALLLVVFSWGMPGVFLFAR